MKLAFEQHGEGTPVILLHAFPFSRKMWEGQIDVLAKNGFRLILPDLPGFGENTNDAEITTMEEMALSVANLMRSLGIEKALIGGLSMGGYAALNLYRLFPEKFSSIILCDTTQLADSDEKRIARFQLAENIKKEGLSEVAENVVPKLIAEYTKQNNPELLKKLKETVLSADKKGVEAALRGMAVRSDHTPTLEEIDVPALLIFGEEDTVTNVENAGVMRKKIKNSELHVIKRCGHMSNLEMPREFNESLLNFVNRVKKFDE